MKPILYDSNETAFTNNGFGVLSDVISCIVTEERNGAFELEMEYPVTGIHFADISLRRILLAAAGTYGEAQPFRIYRITKPLSGTVTIYAEHISYDLSGIIVSPFTAGNAQAALNALKENASTTCPFDFQTDKTTEAEMKVEAPASLRSLLGGTGGSILDVYGGEFEFDRFTVKLHGQRGQDRGVSIRYGKNLTDLNQEENCSNVYTGVYPYWKNDTDGLVQLPEKIVKAEGSYDFKRIMALDLSSEWQEKPTEEQLRTRAQSYVKANNIGVPTVSLDVSFVQLEQTEEYKNLALFDSVSLCDTVTVEFPAMGVSATAKVAKTVYNTLLDRYEKITLGSLRTGLADVLVQQSQNTDKKIDDTKTQMQSAIDNATSRITGNSGGYVVIHDADADGAPDELLILDSPDIDAAKNVWRWNMGGLGFSSTGYNGEYETAITADGSIVANFIQTGTLDAELVHIINLVVDHVKSVAGNNMLEIDGGSFAYYHDGDKKIGLEMANITSTHFNTNVEGVMNLNNNSYKTLLTPSVLKVGEMSGECCGNIYTGHLDAYEINFPKQNFSINAYNDDTLLVVNHNYNGVVGFETGITVNVYDDLKVGMNIDFPYGHIGNWSERLSLMGKYGAKLGYITSDGTSHTIMDVNIGISYLDSDLDMQGNNITNQSDARIKTNIKPTAIRGLDVINGIDLKEFDYIRDGRHSHAGIIAQQLREVAPELVTEDEDGILSINTTSLIFYLIKAVQELSGGHIDSDWTDPYTEEEKQEICNKINEKRVLKIGKD